MRVFALVRYRFFLYAGLLPYLLGAAWAFAMAGAFDATVFWCGLGGVVLSVIGVEAFNEYFDARMGTDRVFNPEDVPPIAVAVFWIGSAAFAAALAVGVYLAIRGGWPILAFALAAQAHHEVALAHEPILVEVGNRIDDGECHDETRRHE